MRHYHEKMLIRSDFLHLDVFVVNAIRIVLILVFAYICTLVVGRLLRGLRRYTVKMMLRAGGGADYELEKRAATIGSLVRKALFILIWLIAWLMILKEMNFDVRPLLAGAGVAGVAIGFGAQNIVKDVLGGLFLMMENQLRVNDVAIINGKGGLVEEINLRTTVLRAEDGAVHIFANGGITSLSNLTREYSFYVFNLSVAYKEDTDRVVAALKDIGEKLQAEEQYHAVILAPLEIMGVDQLGDSGVVIKARFKTVPLQQWMVGREMNRRIKKYFEDEKIDLASSVQPIYLEVSPELRNELKQVVRDVLKDATPAS